MIPQRTYTNQCYLSTIFCRMLPWFLIISLQMAMGHNLWLRFRVDEHPFATCFDVHQGVQGFDRQPSTNQPCGFNPGL